MSVTRLYIPEYIRERAAAFAKARYSEAELVALLEEDACVSPPYHYEIFPTGIGDIIYVVCGDQKQLLNPEDCEEA